MFFVSNLQSSSQAGRRRFESGLPLHKINNLQGIRKGRPPSKPPSICGKARVLTLDFQAGRMSIHGTGPCWRSTRFPSFHQDRGFRLMQYAPLRRSPRAAKPRGMSGGDFSTRSSFSTFSSLDLQAEPRRSR
jgi:hypothetical protein